MSLANIVDAVLASAVAQNGTFTTTYPTGTTAGDFASYGHVLWSEGLQYSFTQDAAGISVSFGASTITVTYKGVDSLPAGSKVTMQYNKRGQDDRRQATRALDEMKRMIMSPMVRLELGAPATADADGICESQTVTFATTPYAVLDGVISDVSLGAKAVLDVPRNVVAGWTGAAVLTVTGKDEYNATVVEKSASGTTFTGKKAFKEITSIAFSANVSAATVGTGDVLGLPAFVEKAGQIAFEMVDGVLLARRGGKVYLQTTQLEAAVDAAGTIYMVSPVAGKIVKAWSCAQSAITTGGDVVVGVGATPVTGLAITVANSAVAGEVDSDTPTLDHATAVVAAGDTITLTPGAAFNASADMFYVVEIDVDGTTLLNGTFVAGVQTAPTATTGDVRGTYDPSSDCDGSKQFALIAVLPDPTYKGVTQYAG